MHVSVVYSLPSKRILTTPYGGTDADTHEIARMVARGLAAIGMQTELVAIDEESIGQIDQIKADCVFNLIEWCGHDIPLARVAFKHLRAINIPVTGSNERLFCLTGDKILMYQKLKKLKISTPISVAFEIGDEAIPAQLPYPLLVKPSLEHCSVGLSEKMLAYNEAELRAKVQAQIKEFAQPVLAQEFIEGRELLVYLIETEKGVKILPIVEMLFAKQDGTGFQTYDCKWVEVSSDYQTSDYKRAELTESVEQEIRELCTQAFKEMDFWGYARFDLRLRDETPYILETNANPSVYDATEEIEDMETEVIEGIKFADYLEQIVKSAIRHYKHGDRV